MKKDRIYKLQFITIYKGGDFEIGFGNLDNLINQYCLRSSENCASLSNEGLKINKIRVNNIVIEDQKYMNLK